MPASSFVFRLPGQHSHAVILAPRVRSAACAGARLGRPPLNRCSCDPARYKYKTAPKSLLIGPIFGGKDGETVVGLIEMVNKTGGEHFDRNDEKLLKLLCSHASVFIAQVNG